MNILPSVKQSDIVIQNIGDELLIYNLKTNQAYSLNETSKNIYQFCNGKTSFDELKQKFNYSDDLIFLALDELKRNDLIEESYQSKFAGVSRREVIRKVGLSTMIALPFISSIVAPSAANAQSIICLNPSGRLPGVWNQANCLKANGSLQQCTTLCQQQTANFCCTGNVVAQDTCAQHGGNSDYYCCICQ